MPISYSLRTSAPVRRAASSQHSARHAEIDALLATLPVGTWADIDERPDHSPRATSIGFHHRARTLGYRIETMCEEQFVSVIVRSAPSSALATEEISAPGALEATEAPDAEAPDAEAPDAEAPDAPKALRSHGRKAS